MFAIIEVGIVGCDEYNLDSFDLYSCAKQYNHDILIQCIPVELVGTLHRVLKTDQRSANQDGGINVREVRFAGGPVDSSSNQMLDSREKLLNSLGVGANSLHERSKLGHDGILEPPMDDFLVKPASCGLQS